MIVVTHSGTAHVFESIKQSRAYAAGIAWNTIITVTHGSRTIFCGHATSY